MSILSEIVATRAYDPDAIPAALRRRARRSMPIQGEKILVLACDHPARSALGAGNDPMAMASREEVLERCAQILSHSSVSGFLGTADMVEDLALMGALDNKLVWGSMNRGGLLGSSFEMDDRFTGYTAKGIDASHLDGGKMLTRINYEDAGTVATLEACAESIDDLSSYGLNAMVEPFISRWSDGKIVNDLSPDAVIHSIAIASGLGTTSRNTWLKLPCVPEMERVMESTTLPSLILGGAVSEDPETTFRQWNDALSLPNVIGLVIGRSLMFPPNGDIDGTVNKLVEML
ncbi:deoxyribose-phosphate aldolase [Actinomycetaceae bacterium WB03_NA08]|uniref:Deoxyribose-phosphate aldolase n=1 Tax=Scrofimicrobium canadense TaxID=2652290 RepID=A0A6N7W8L9_9ACTO|nr:deoxyribose-phosphate aldolase [Scrofimicrobium canadense]MSS84616.1 deoxyribose-phosphate aldolase [Scrofimicrobium canadense]